MSVCMSGCLRSIPLLSEYLEILSLAQARFHQEESSHVEPSRDEPKNVSD